MQPLLDQCRELCMLDNELSYFEFVVTSANHPVYLRLLAAIAAVRA
ncbi:unnamed protein product [Dibothriocephalus latus]|uniref:Uncharacterized protein n=1 Tax=Dibothriocephalus latus TaxID=60516 RepID=A0A3P6PIN0_DIBLA|nr:unnamed protein product [Dibothriocephalus latus]